MRVRAWGGGQPSVLLRRDVVLLTLCKIWHVLTRNACCNDVAVGLGPDKVKNLDVRVRVRLCTVAQCHVTAIHTHVQAENPGLPLTPLRKNSVQIAT